MPKKWLESLDDDARAEAEELIEQLRDLGCPEPMKWAHRELHDDTPQRSRAAFLRHLWSEVIEGWRDSTAWVVNLRDEPVEEEVPSFPEARDAVIRMLSAGIRPDEIAELARFVAYESVFSVVHTLDEGFDPEADGPQPGWALVERDLLGHPTGRVMARLHEDLDAFEGVDDPVDD